MKASRIAGRLVQLAFVGMVVFAWYWSTRSGRVNPLLLPPLSSVWLQFRALLVSGDYWPDLRVTLYELALAFLLAASSGSVVGYLVGRSGYMVRVFDPLLAGMYSIPAILLFPLYVLFFGIGTGSKIAMGSTIAFFPVAMNTITALNRVDRSYLLAARSMGASGAQTFWKVLLPAALPVLTTGFRIGLISAFLAILGTETLASFAGLGHRIVESAEGMDTARMYAYIVLVLLLAAFLNTLVSIAESRGRWRTQ